MGRRADVAPRPFSERRFHRWLAREFGDRSVGALPVGDDAAAIPLGGGRVALLTTDALTEGTHFLRGSPPRAIGRAAAGVSLSDVAAKGGTPVAFLLDLLLPPDTPERWARAVAMGAEERLAEFGAHVVGGDTKPSGTRSVVGSLMGFGHANRLCPRSGARPGDWVVTTGVVGAGGVAMAGIRGNQSPARAALVRLLDVEPRVREGAALARHAHAMLDTSDGLAEAARLLADASGVGVVIDPDRLPLHPALARRTGSRQSKLGHAFFGGDYELLGTIPAQRVRRLQRTLGRLGCPLTVVGRVEAGHGAWLESGPDRRPMPRGGWQPFGSGSGDL